MPGRILSVPGTNNMMYAAFQATLQEPESSRLWSAKYTSERNGRWCYRGLWSYECGLWPMSQGGSFCGDPAPLANNDLTWGLADRPWGPQLRRNMGCDSTFFIMGRCVDADGNGVSGATVQGFLTNGDIYVGETTADSGGYYQLSTPYSGQQHYLVAYLDAATDIGGTTVNTITPTNADGT